MLDQKLGKMHRIEIGPQVPRWGNAFLAALARKLLELLGWRLDVRLPDLPKFVMIAVPHTSNWDFVIGICAVLAIRVRVRWWVKHTVYRAPVRHIVDWLGGIPINRGAAHGVVEQTVAAFQREPQLVLSLTPEGTRSRVEKWKRGFYHVALRTGVPVVLAYMDYRLKRVVAGPMIQPSGDYDTDVAKMLEYFDGVTPRHPELYSGKA